MTAHRQMQPFTIDPSVANLYHEIADVRRARAFLASKADDVASIRHYRSRGMSTRRLEEIYGRDLVDVAVGRGLAPLEEAEISTMGRR